MRRKTGSFNTAALPSQARPGGPMTARLFRSISTGRKNSALTFDGELSSRMMIPPNNAQGSRAHRQSRRGLWPRPYHAARLRRQSPATPAVPISAPAQTRCPMVREARPLRGSVVKLREADGRFGEHDRALYVGRFTSLRSAKNPRTEGNHSETDPGSPSP